MRKTFLATFAIVALISGAALAGGNNGNNGGGNNCQGNSCGGNNTPAPVGFTLGAGVVGGSGSGTVVFSSATGTQKGSGVSFGKTEGAANAAANFQLGTNVGFSANAATGVTSSSVGGSLTNGKGSASQITFGGSGAVAGFGGVAGGGAAFH